MRIYEMSEADLPTGRRHYKTFSAFYIGGYGFRIMEGDATNPTPGNAYHPLGFEHHDDDGYSSSLTNAVQGTQLRCHRADQAWVSKLLPNTYYGAPQGGHGQGGLKGHLPIFLALMALSMPETYVRTYLPHMYSNGAWLPDAWQTLGLNYGRADKRGVVVKVYSVPIGDRRDRRDRRTNDEAIRCLEEGQGQRYFY